MSHHATNWAIQRRGLKPATKIVLWHLADCHNPAHGCFPTQEHLAWACEMSRASINRHLEELEALGLIRRETSVDPQTKRQLPTRYVLMIDGEGDIQPPTSGSAVRPSRPPRGPGPQPGAASQNETRAQDVGSGSQNETREKTQKAVSQNGPKPCLKNGESRVSNCDTNPVREPVREPVSVVVVRAETEFAEGEWFRRVLDVVGLNPSNLPRRWRPPAARVEVDRWREIDPRHLTDALILEHLAEACRHHGAAPKGPIAFEAGLRALASVVATGASSAPMHSAKPRHRPAANALTHEQFSDFLRQGISG